MVQRELLEDVMAVVGTELVQNRWVEEYRLRYVVVRSITEPEWLKDGLTMLKGGAVGSGLGNKALVVVRRVGNTGAGRVPVKVEILSREEPAALLKEGVVFLGLCK